MTESIKEQIEALRFAGNSGYASIGGKLAIETADTMEKLLALRPFARHADTCPSMKYGGKCTCGFDGLIAALDENSN